MFDQDNTVLSIPAARKSLTFSVQNEVKLTSLYSEVAYCAKQERELFSILFNFRSLFVMQKIISICFWNQEMIKNKMKLYLDRFLKF